MQTGTTYLRKRWTIAGVSLLGLILVSCGGRAAPTPTVAPTNTPAPTATFAPTDTPVPPTPSPTDTPVPTDTPEPASVEVNLIEEGEAIYESVGCNACHGADGQGGVGPALPGHTPEQIRNQVRNPRGGVMPAYSDEKLSDDDLEKLIAFIQSLGEGELAEMHGHGEFTATADQVAHLRLVLDALAVDNDEDAIHHARHLVDASTDETREMAEELLSLLEAGEHHDAEHLAEGLLESVDVGEEADLTPLTLHLGMASQGTEIEDLDEVRHHLTHALESDGGEEIAAEINEAISLAEEGDWHEAEEIIAHLLAEGAE